MPKNESKSDQQQGGKGRLSVPKKTNPIKTPTSAPTAGSSPPPPTILHPSPNKTAPAEEELYKDAKLKKVEMAPVAASPSNEGWKRKMLTDHKSKENSKELIKTTNLNPAQKIVDSSPTQKIVYGKTHAKTTVADSKDKKAVDSKPTTPTSAATTPGKEVKRSSTDPKIPEQKPASAKPAPKKTVVYDPTISIKTLEERIEKWATEKCKLPPENLNAEFHFLKVPDGVEESHQNTLTQCRYNSISCWDRSRVPLKGKSAQEDNFIHANFIDGSFPKQFVASQAPLPEEFQNFWSLICSEKICVILMLCGFVEAKKRKADPYFQLKPGSTSRHPPYTILTKSIKLLKIAHQRIVHTRGIVWKEGDRDGRQFLHLIFSSWPDMGTPHGGLPLALLSNYIEDKQVELCQGQNLNPKTSPILLHCSAGVGRTGTYLGIRLGLYRLLSFGSLDLPEVVGHIRQQRAGSVQTIDQYQFIYMVIFDTIHSLRLTPNFPYMLPKTFGLAENRQISPNDIGQTDILRSRPVLRTEQGTANSEQQTSL